MSDLSDEARRLVRGLVIALFVIALVVVALSSIADRSGKHDNPKPTHSASNHK